MGIFSNLPPAEKEAFFALLDEYFESRPHLLSNLSSQPASTPSYPPPPGAPSPPTHSYSPTPTSLASSATSFVSKHPSIVTTIASHSRNPLVSTAGRLGAQHAASHPPTPKPINDSSGGSPTSTGGGGGGVNSLRDRFSGLSNMINKNAPGSASAGGAPPPPPPPPPGGPPSYAPPPHAPPPSQDDGYSEPPPAPPAPPPPPVGGGGGPAHYKPGGPAPAGLASGKSWGGLNTSSGKSAAGSVLSKASLPSTRKSREAEAAKAAASPGLQLSRTSSSHSSSSFAPPPQRKTAASNIATGGAPPPPPPPPPVAGGGSGLGTARGLYDYEGDEADDLPFQEGDLITITEKVSDDWWRGKLNGREGIFPANYVEMQ